MERTDVNKQSAPRRLSFMFRIFIGCLLIALVPLVVASFLMVRMFNTSLQSRAMEDGKAQAAMLEQQLDQAFASIEEISEHFAQDSFLIHALIDNGPNIQDKAYATIYKTAGGLQNEAEFSLYDAGGKLRFSTYPATAEPSLPTFWGVLKQAGLANGAMVYNNMESFTNAHPDALLRTGQTLRVEQGAQVGYSVITLSENSFNSLFNDIIQPQNLVMLLNNTGSLVYTSHPQKSAGSLPWVQAALRQGSMQGSDATSYFFAQRNSRSGYYVVLVQPKPFTDTTLQTMRRISIITALVCLLLCVLFSVVISRGLSRPISALSSAMKQVKIGRLDVRVQNARNDELGQLTRDFNKMISDLEKYVSQTLRHQQDMNEAQIRLLQTQLNPHFLYNTLDTVKWLAKMHGIPEIASITSSLAIILRQCVSREQFVTLGQEMGMIQSYIDIQRIRFSGKFQYVTDVPKDLEECIVPKLILQPVVENAILHGLANKADGYIYIYATKQDNTLKICITDDGSGMSPEAAARINQPEAKIVEGHLGLYNVSSILRMNYGEGYGLHASTRHNVGTTITLTIPLNMEDTHA